jgi:Mor family transcriptional regulator
MNRKDKIKGLREELKRLIQEEKAEKKRGAQICKEEIDRAKNECWEWRLIGGSHPDIAKRNIEMFRDWCAGASFAEIGRKHGITRDRVRQINYKVCRCLYRNNLALDADSSIPDDELRSIFSRSLAQAEDLMQAAN